MATVIGLTNEQRDEIWESMTAEQVKVLKNFDRFLWKSYNLTVQYNNSAKWDFIGIEIDHFYKRGTRHQKNYLKCDVCGYHPIKRCYVLKSQERDQVVGMGLDCFKEHVIIPEKAKKEIHQYLNDINEFRDQILMSYHQGKRFPNVLYLRAVKNPKFDPNNSFGRRILEFKAADLPLYSRDHGHLKRLGRDAGKAIFAKQYEQERLEKLQATQPAANTEYQEAITTFTRYRLWTLAPFLEQFFDGTDWKVAETPQVGKIFSEEYDQTHCVCGAVIDYQILLKNRHNESSLLIDPRHVSKHTSVTDEKAAPLVEQINNITAERNQILQKYEEGKKFPKSDFEYALSEGFFDPEDKGDVLDYCEVLKDANLPLPDQIEHELQEFNERYDKELTGEVQVVINAYQMIFAMVQQEMPGSKKVDDVRESIEKYVSRETNIDLPVVDENSIGELTAPEKNDQLYFRKMELYLFASTFKDKFSQEKQILINNIINMYVDREVREGLADNINKLQEYVAKEQ